MDDHDELAFLDAFEDSAPSSFPSIRTNFRPALLNPDTTASGLEQYLIDEFEAGNGTLIIDLDRDRAGEPMGLTSQERAVVIENIARMAETVPAGRAEKDMDKDKDKATAVRKPRWGMQVLPEGFGNHAIVGTLERDKFVVPAGSGGGGGGGTGLTSPSHHSSHRSQAAPSIPSPPSSAPNSASATSSTAKSTTLSHSRSLSASSSPSWPGAIVLRRRTSDLHPIQEIRVSVVGNVDAGKSTTLGVLTRGIRDDGRGLVRVNLFRHQHEVDSGRTSSVGAAMLGFDAEGVPVYPPRTTVAENAVMSSVAREQVNKVLAENASKIVCFSDLAGHSKYLRTTVYGLTSSMPDYCLLMVGANQGLIGTAREHLGLALTLNLPVITVVTKIDMCPASKLKETRAQILALYRSVDHKKATSTAEIGSLQDCLAAAPRFVNHAVRPIFYISNVSGQNVGLLKVFFSLLKPLAVVPGDPPGHGDGLAESHQPTTANQNKNQDPNQNQNQGPQQQQHPYMSVTETFSVPFVGTVVSGVVRAGSFKVKDTVLVGPSEHGDFITTRIRSIQILRQDVPECHAGQSAAIALRNLPVASVRRGMVLQLLPPAVPGAAGAGQHQHQHGHGHAGATAGGADGVDGQRLAAVREFVAEMKVLPNTTSMTSNYQAMTHIGAIEQTCALSFPEIDVPLGRKKSPSGKDQQAQSGDATTTITTTTATADAAGDTTQKSAPDADFTSPPAREARIIRGGDTTIVLCRFMGRPECVRVGEQVIFREGKTKALGTVLEVGYDWDKNPHRFERVAKVGGRKAYRMHKGNKGRGGRR